MGICHMVSPQPDNLWVSLLLFPCMGTRQQSGQGEGMCKGKGGVSLITVATNPHHLVTHSPVVMATEEHHTVTYCHVPKETSPTPRRVKDPLRYSSIQIVLDLPVP